MSKIIVCNLCEKVTDIIVSCTVSTPQGFFVAKNYPQRKIACKCNHCNQSDHLELVVLGFVDLSSIELGKFSMLTFEQKQQSLRLRSREHAKKYIAPYKEQVDQDFRRQAKSIIDKAK